MAQKEMIQVGSKVRSFDFESRDLEGERACYVEGVVKAIGEVMEGCERYVIEVTRDVFGGEDSDRRVGITVYPPINGTPSWLGGSTNCVELV